VLNTKRKVPSWSKRLIRLSYSKLKKPQNNYLSTSGEISRSIRGRERLVGQIQVS
jgi:hypothetical protein